MEFKNINITRTNILDIDCIARQLRDHKHRLADITDFPIPSGNNNKILAVVNNVPTWIINPGLPSFTGNAGKYLTTDGTQAIWQFIPVQQQADWNETDNLALSFIQNKPYIPQNISDLVNDSGYVLSTLTLTINGITYDLSFNRTWNLTTTDIPEGTNLYYSNSRARAALSLTTSGNNGSATYNSSTGAFNIPTYTLAGLGGVPLTRTITINGITYDLDANRTWTLTTADIAELTNLYFTDSRARAAISNTTTGLTYNSSTGVLSLTSGYIIPTTSDVSNWDTAYSWGDHSTQGYVLGSGVAITNQIAYFVAPNTISSLSTSTYPSLFELSYVKGVTSSIQTQLNGKQPVGDYITSLTGEVTASGPGAASATLLNSAVIGKVLTGLNVTGGSIVDTDSILAAFGKAQNQINGLMGGATYQNVWNASTNSPTITSSVGTKGHYYVVNVAGSTNINGITDWKVGDWIIFNGATWDKVDNTDAVSSVNGFVGAVSLTTANIPEVTNLYYLDSRARAAISNSATGLTYNNSTGVFTLTSGYVIPTTTQETNWTLAYTQTRQWDGGATGLVAATGRTSLGLVIGVDVLAYRTFGTAANNNTGDFYASGSTVVNSTLWAGMSYLGSQPSDAIYAMVYSSAGSNWRPLDVTGFRTFLGLGSMAYQPTSNYYLVGEIQNYFSGASAMTGYNKTNWDTAFGWGNHASLYYTLGSTVANSTLWNGVGINLATYGSNAGDFLNYDNTLGIIKPFSTAQIQTKLGLGSMAYASTGSYVAKAGDTMTGHLVMSNYNLSNVGTLLVYASGSHINIDAVRGSYFGYSPSYPTLVLGTNSGNTTLAFNVDVVANPSGDFSGGGSEYLWRNVGAFKTPNAANTNYNTLFSWGNGVITVANNLYAQVIGTLNGVTTSEANNVNTIVTRSVNGDIHVRLLRSEYTGGGAASDGYILMQNVIGAGAVDNYARPTAIGTFKDFLNLGVNDSTYMRYQGFTLDANTMLENRTGFTYASNAPYTGPILHVGAAGYGLQLNATYSGGGELLAFRSRNGDTASWNGWNSIWHEGNFTPGNYVPYTGATTNVNLGSWSLSAYNLTASNSVLSNNYYRTSGTPMLAATTNYNILYSQTGVAAIFLGGTGDPANYYDNTTHFFRSISGGATYASIQNGVSTFYGAADAYNIDTVNRTTYRDVFHVTANATSLPYGGHGGGILFRGSTYQQNGSNVTYARIGTIINSDSVNTYGSTMFFDIATNSSGATARAFELYYTGRTKWFYNAEINGSDRILELKSPGGGNNSLLRYSDGSTAKYSTGFNNSNYIIYDDVAGAYRFSVLSSGTVRVDSGTGFEVQNGRSMLVYTSPGLSYTQAGTEIYSSGAYGPRLSLHWGGVVASQISVESGGRVAIINNPGTSYEAFVAGAITSTGEFVGSSYGTFGGRTRIGGGYITDIAGAGNSSGIGFGSSGVYPVDGGASYSSTKDLGYDSLPWRSAYLSGAIRRTNPLGGYLHGGYAAIETSATPGLIYALGDSYLPTSSATATMYGIGYTNSAFAGNPLATSGWGLYVAGAGTMYHWLGTDMFKTIVPIISTASGASSFSGALVANGLYTNSGHNVVLAASDIYFSNNGGYGILSANASRLMVIQNGQLSVQGVLQMSTYQLGFNEGGVRSWTINTSSGNLLFNSGDGGGNHIFQSNSVSANYYDAQYAGAYGNYNGKFDWNLLQLGNNGPNYIVGGHAVAGGWLDFYVNNTNNVVGTTPNGTHAMRLDPDGTFRTYIGAVIQNYTQSPNFRDYNGAYNVNLGSGGLEGRGLVAGYSGGNYGGIGYNIRHTGTSSSWIAPGADNVSYLSFNAGFTFSYAPGGAANRDISGTLATILRIDGDGSMRGYGPFFPGHNNSGFTSQPNYYIQGWTTGGGLRTNGNFVTIGDNYSTNYYVSDWFRNQTGNVGLYNQANNTHFSSSSSVQWDFATAGGSYIQIALRPSGHGSTIRGYIYADTSNNVGFLAYDGNWALRTDSSKNVFTYSALFPGSNDLVGGAQQGTYYFYGNTAAGGIRTNGSLLANADIYLGTRATWLSTWLNQGVTTTDRPTFLSLRADEGFTSASAQGRFGGWYNGVGFTGAAVEIGYSGGTGNVIAYNRNTSVYSPIYLAGSEVHLTPQGGNIRATGNIVMSNYGLGLVGLYSSTLFQGIFAMGESYTLPNNGANTGSLYGLAWSYPSAGGQAANLSSHGLLVVVNGTTVAAISSNIWVSGSITAVGGGFNSDLTLKNVIGEGSLINIADQNKVIRFTWKDQTKGISMRYGYGAQYIQALIPEAVYVTGDGTLAVDYTQVHTVLIDENTRRIQALEAEVAELKEQLNRA